MGLSTLLITIGAIAAGIRAIRYGVVRIQMTREAKEDAQWEVIFREQIESMKARLASEQDPAVWLALQKDLQHLESIFPPKVEKPASHPLQDAIQFAFSAHGFTRLWKGLGFLFGHDTRERIYDPSVGELIEDFLLVQEEQSKGWKAWFAFCFTVRTLVVFLACVRVAILKPLAKLIPAKLKGWWNLLF